MKIFYEINKCEDCHFREEYDGIQPYCDDFCHCANRAIPWHSQDTTPIPKWCPFNVVENKTS